MSIANLDRIAALGRLILASLFILGAVAKAASPGFAVEMLGGLGLPGWLVYAVILGEGLGGLMVAWGGRLRLIAAPALAAYTILVNVALHPFWAFDGAPEQTEMQAQIALFFKNVSIAGGLIYAAALEARRSRPDV
ncbi:MAG: DoxX family membrane protein [Pseudomonadota bacterium]